MKEKADQRDMGKEKRLLQIALSSLTSPVLCNVCNVSLSDRALLRQHLVSPQHKKKVAKKDAGEDFLFSSLPKACDAKTTPAHIAAIDALVKSIAEEFQMTPEMLQQRRDTVRELSNLLNASVTGCRLDLVGSTLSGFAMKTSNVNINICKENGLSIFHALLAVRELVEKSDKYSAVEDDLCSSFQKLSFTHVSTGLRFVVGAGNKCSKMTNKLLGDYACLDERVPILGVAFRRWTQLCHIDEQYKGTLPAHAFPIMVVHFLQQHKVPVLPVLHQLVKKPDGETSLRPSEFDQKWVSSNNLSVGELWLDMFQFYVVRFVMADLVINITKKEPCVRSKNTWMNNVAIEDPFQQKQMITRTVSSSPVFEYIIDSFIITYKYFTISKIKKGNILKNIAVKDKNEGREKSSKSLYYKEDSMIPILEDPRSTLPLITPVMDHKMNKKATNDDFNFRFDTIFFTKRNLPPLICRSCQKRGHCEAECQEYNLPPLIQLPLPDKAFMQMLTSILEQLTKAFELTKDEIEDRDIIVADLEKYITSADGFSGAQLQLFGSSANGCGFKSSDLDISLTLDVNPTNQHVNQINIIKKLANNLRQYCQYQNIFAITATKVPIVKFSIKRRVLLEGDLSFNNTLAVQNTNLLATYTKIDPRVKCLGYAMKYFAKLCDIGDTSQGSLSSYAYILMVLHFLQRTTPPVIPVLQELYDHSKPAPKLIIKGWNAWFYDDVSNLSSIWPDLGKNKESVGELWIGMLRYYTESFNWKENVVTIKQFAPLTRLEKMWNTQCIVIEDPFDLNHNLGASLSRRTSTFIMKVFIRGREIFGSSISNLPPGCINLVEYLFDVKKLTVFVPSYDPSCKICGENDHIQRVCPKNKNKQEMKIKMVKEDRKEKIQYEEPEHKQKYDIKVNEIVSMSLNTSPSSNIENISYCLKVPNSMLKSHSECWKNDTQYVEEGKVNLGMNRYRYDELSEGCCYEPGTVVLTSDNKNQKDSEYMWTFNAQVVYASLFRSILLDYKIPYWDMYHFILKSVKDNVIPGIECFQNEIDQQGLFGEALKRIITEVGNIRIAKAKKSKENRKEKKVLKKQKKKKENPSKQEIKEAGNIHIAKESKSKKNRKEKRLLKKEKEKEENLSNHENKENKSEEKYIEKMLQKKKKVNKENASNEEIKEVVNIRSVKESKSKEKRKEKRLLKKLKSKKGNASNEENVS